MGAAMIEHRLYNLPVFDSRSFSLVDYQHAHSHAVIRGYPEYDDDSPGDATLRIVDLFFAGVSRIACWKDIGKIALRHPSAQECQTLESRIGRWRSSESVFLLEPSSLESYVVASRVFWAEFQIGSNAMSPLATDNEEYRKNYPPIGGTIRYSD